MVQTVKKMLKRSEDPYIALLVTGQPHCHGVVSSSVEHGKNSDTDPTDKQATSSRVDLLKDISREGQTVQANSKAEL